MTLETADPRALSSPARSKLASNPWWAGTVAGMASYIDAAAITAFSASLVIFEKLFDLSAGQVGIAASTLTLAMAIGAAVGGRLGDRFGRRPVFVITMFFIIAGALALMTAQDFTAIFLGVAIMGFAIGADLPVSLATISEAADDENRGRLLGFSNLLWLVGIAANGICVALFGDLGRSAITFIFGHVVLVSVIVLLARLTIPESQLWLDARAARKAGDGVQKGEAVQVSTLFRAPYLVPFLGLAIFYAGTGILGNTNGQYLSYMMVKEAGFTVSSAAKFSFLALPLVLVGFLWFMRIADKPARFRYFQVGAVCYVLMPLVIATFGFSATTLIFAFILNAIGASFAFEGMYRVWSQQSFPTLVRTTAQGTIIAIARLVAAAAASVTPLLLQEIGVRALYGILAMTTLIGVGAAWIVFRSRDQHSEFEVAATSLHP